MLEGVRSYREHPTLGRTTRTPEAVDGPPSYHLADFVVLWGYNMRVLL